LAGKLKDPTSQVCAEIAAGEHDLERISVAIAACQRSGQRSLRWYFDLDVFGVDGLTGTFDDGDMTLNDCIMVERMTGKTWVSFNPIEAAAMAHPLLTMAFASHLGIERDKAAEMTQNLRAEDVLESVKQREVEPADPPEPSDS
jgi:hypothetical protein